jgi:hypothetical protein
MAAGIYRLTVNDKIKSTSKLRAALRHNLRESSREVGNRIDPQRKHLNVTLAGEDNTDAIMARQKQLMASVKPGGRPRKDGRPRKVRGDGVLAIEFMLALEPGSSVDELEVCRRGLAWLDQRHDVPVLSATVHRDEGAGHVHLHAILLPVRDSRMVGSALVGQFVRLQADFFAEVALEFDLERNLRPDAATREQAAQDVMDALDADPSLITAPEFCAWLQQAITLVPSSHLKKLQKLLGLSMPVAQPREKGWVRIMTKPVKSTPRAKAIGFDQGVHDAQPDVDPLACVRLHLTSQPPETASMALEDGVDTDQDACIGDVAAKAEPAAPGYHAGASILSAEAVMILPAWTVSGTCESAPAPGPIVIPHIIAATPDPEPPDGGDGRTVEREDEFPVALWDMGQGRHIAPLPVKPPSQKALMTSAVAQSLEQAQARKRTSW